MDKPVVDSASQGGFNGSGSGVSFSHTLNPGVSPYLLVFIDNFIASTSITEIVVTGVTFNGVALTRYYTLPYYTDGGTQRHGHEIWYLPGNLMPAPGTYTIAVTFAGTVNQASVASVSYFNVKPVVPEAGGLNLANETNGTPIVASVTTLTAKAMVVGFYGARGGAGLISVGSGESIDQNVLAYDEPISISHEDTINPGSVSLQFDDAFGTECALSVLSLPYNPVGGAAALAAV